MSERPVTVGEEQVLAFRARRHHLLGRGAASPEAAARAALGIQAEVRATVLDRGRLVATWNHKAVTRVVKIEITPLTGWRPGLERELEADVAAFARHLEVDGFQLEIVS